MGKITKTSLAPGCLKLAMLNNKSILTYMNHTDGELFLVFPLNNYLYVILYSAFVVTGRDAVCSLNKSFLRKHSFNLQRQQLVSKS